MALRSTRVNRIIRSYILVFLLVLGLVHASTAQVITLEVNGSAQTSCISPDGIGYIVSVAEDGVPQDLADYDFEWYESDSIILLPGAVSGPTYSGLEEGAYVVRARDLLTSDYSEFERFTIALSPPDLPVLSTITTPSVSCDPNFGTGTIALDVDAGSDPADYIITWYESNGSDPLGVSTITAIVSGDGTAVSGVTGGSFVVEVSASTSVSGCARRQAVPVNSEIPFLNISVTDISIQHENNCTTPNGALEVTRVEENGIPASLDDYEYYWYEGQVFYYDTALADYKGIRHEALSAGAYTVLALHKQTHCTSTPVSGLVEDQILYPVADIIIANNTSCTDQPNGKLEADVAGNAEDHSIEWFNGTELVPEHLIADTIALSDLPEGIYSLRLTNLNTTCQNSWDKELLKIRSYPVVSASVTREQENCDPDNQTGAAKADVMGNTEGYSFYWFEGAFESPDTAEVAFRDPELSGLEDGNYTVMAMHNYTRCLSEPVTVNIKNLTELPEITVNVEHNTSCDLSDPNGVVWVSAADATVDYSFAWHELTANQDTVFLSDEAELPSRTPGLYRTLVTEVATGCQSHSEVVVEDHPAVPLPSINIDAHQTSCIELSPNGMLSGSAADDIEGLIYYWFKDNIADPDTALAENVGPVYDDLDTGSYTMVALDPEVHCLSGPAFASVEDNVVLPDIEIHAEQDTSELGLITFTLMAEVDQMAEPEYAFRWFEGPDTLAENQIGIWSTMAGLDPGTFTVIAREAYTGCQETEEIMTRGFSPLAAKDLSLQVLAYNKIRIHWSDVAEREDGYIIERSSINSTGFIKVDTVSANTTVYTDVDLKAETEYTYRISSYNIHGNSPSEETIAGTTFIEPPNGNPSDLIIEGIDPWTIKLTWIDNSFNEDGFVVERYNHEAGAFEAIDTVTLATFTDQQLVPGTEYLYRIIAYNGGGISKYTKVVTFTPVITDLADLEIPDIRLYPNPVIDYLNVEMPSQNPYDLALYDMNGNLLKQQQGNRGLSVFDLKNISRQVLILRIHTSGGVYTERIIKK